MASDSFCCKRPPVSFQRCLRRLSTPGSGKPGRWKFGYKQPPGQRQDKGENEKNTDTQARQRAFCEINKPMHTTTALPGPPEKSCHSLAQVPGAMRLYNSTRNIIHITGRNQNQKSTRCWRKFNENFSQASFCPRNTARRRVLWWIQMRRQSAG